MLPQFAYLLVIIIWATTPLAIKLGGESFAPLAGLSLRIVLAFMVGSVICTLVGYSGLNIRRHWKLYAIDQPFPQYGVDLHGRHFYSFWIGCFTARFNTFLYRCVV